MFDRRHRRPRHSHISHMHCQNALDASHRSPLDRRSGCERRAGRMNRKTDQIRAAWAAGHRIGALRIAARFFDRSADTRTFKRGMDAYSHPDFYQQLGKNPEQLTAAALELLVKKLAWAPTIIRARDTSSMPASICVLPPRPMSVSGSQV